MGELVVVLGLVGEEHEYSVWSGSASDPWRRAGGLIGQTFVEGPAAIAETAVLVTQPPDELSHGGILASGDGLNWTQVVVNDDLTLVAHGPGGFLALGDRTAFLSVDGWSWMRKKTHVALQAELDDQALAWNAMAAAPWGGWVALGETGAGSGTVLGRSADGFTWTTAPVGTIDEDLVEIACAAAGCVALGWRYEGPDQRSWVVFSSTDGDTWTPVPDFHGRGSGDPLHASAVGERLAVLVGGVVYLSTDLRSWDQISSAGLPAGFWATAVVESGRSDLVVLGSVPVAQRDDTLRQAVSVLGSAADR